MRRIIVAIVFVTFALAFWGQDLKLQANPAQLAVLPGAPLDLTITVINSSGHNLIVLGDSVKQSMHLAGILYTAQGVKIACSQESASWVTGHSSPSTWPKCEFPNGGTLTVSSGIYSQERCPLTEVPPGQYEGRITVTAQILTGDEVEMLSSELRIPVEVRQPTGQDAAYLKALHDALRQYEKSAHPVRMKGVPLSWHEVLSSFRIHSGQIALSRFPTSSYAAYVVYGTMHGFMQGEQSMFLRSIERGTYLANSYPDDTGKSKDGWRSLQGDAAAAWWSKWINIILTNHPDIWFADQLRLKRAVDQVALKNYQIGAADLETLSKEATPEVAQKAQKMLGMLRTKGWIKKEPPTSQVKAP